MPHERSPALTFNSTLGASLIALSLVSSAVAHAGGAPVATAAPVAAAAPKPTMAFSFDLTPEFYATNKLGSYSKGDLAGNVAKFGLSKALPNGMSVGGSLALTVREPGITGTASSYAALEVNTSHTNGRVV